MTMLPDQSTKVAVERKNDHLVITLSPVLTGTRRDHYEIVKFCLYPEDARQLRDDLAQALAGPMIPNQPEEKGDAMLHFRLIPGQHIDQACAEACARADAENLPVKFQFNRIVVIARPGETPDVVRQRYDQDCEAQAVVYLSSPEYAALQAAHQKRGDDAA